MSVTGQLRAILSGAHFVPSKITTRDRICELIESSGEAVEVGTHIGQFAEKILSSWGGNLTCVDLWADYDGYDDIIVGRNRDRDFEICKTRLSKFGNRVRFIRKSSIDAARDFSNESLDLVYIDANHDEKYVREDIAAWWPKVKPGGILSGHDLTHDRYKGIEVAVRDFAYANKRTIEVVCEPYATWIARK